MTNAVVSGWRCLLVHSRLLAIRNFFCERSRIGEELHFFYDDQSCPAFVAYNGVKYCYAHNMHGNIVGIVDADGALVIEYRYDTGEWGMRLF